MQKITPCLWFNNQAEEAAEFYKSLFKNSKIGDEALYGDAGSKVSGQKKGSVMTVDFEIEGLKVVALNGGPHFKFTPSFSFFVWRKSEKEVETLWKALSRDGQVRMGLEKYPWSKKYGWTADKYGVEWQIMVSDQYEKIAPAFLFVDKLFGKGEEAVKYYSSLFKDSKIDTLSKDEKSNAILHCMFQLAGQTFVLSEGPGKHDYTFSPAFSLMVDCRDQKEVDKYWDEFTAKGKESKCGWVEDKYGVSWQVVPSELGKLMAGKDAQKTENMMKAMLNMRKLDIETLKQAYR